METIANHKADREELNQLINDYEETMEAFNYEVTDVLQSQSSVKMCTIQPVNFAEIHTVEQFEISSDIRAIKTFWSGMVDADDTTKSNFSEVQPDVKELGQKMITFLEAIGKNGGKVDSLNIKELQSAVFDDQGMLDSLQDKLTEGKALSPVERDLLYQYLQNDFFGKEDHEKMDEIADLMDDKGEFKDYINEEVLATEAHLEAEIMFLESYLFTGNERPSDLKDSQEDRIKLNNYLQILNNLHMDINETRQLYNWDRSREDPLYAHVENIEYDFSPDTHSGHSKAEITIMARPGNLEEYHTREEVAELDEHPYGAFIRTKSISDIEYFWGPDGVTEYSERKILNDMDEIRTYTSNFISAQVISIALGLIPGGGVKDAIIAHGEYKKGAKQNEQKLTNSVIEQAAIRLKLELQVNTHRGGSHVEVNVLPTEETLMIIDRWKAVHQIDSDYPYPATEIEEQDWIGINQFLRGEDGEKAKMVFDGNMEIDDAVYKYIISGTTSSHPVVEEVEKIINY